MCFQWPSFSVLGPETLGSGAAASLAQLRASSSDNPISLRRAATENTSTPRLPCGPVGSEYCVVTGWLFSTD